MYKIKAKMAGTKNIKLIKHCNVMLTWSIKYKFHLDSAFSALSSKEDVRLDLMVHSKLIHCKGKIIFCVN